MPNVNRLLDSSQVLFLLNKSIEQSEQTRRGDIEEI